MKKLKSCLLMLAIASLGPATFAQTMDKTVMVGGAPMYPTRNIVENAAGSKDHTTLVAAVKAAGLVEVLQGPGPFTVFAPTNQAFDMLPAGTVDNLLKPQNREMLASILTYHVVPGRYSQADIARLIDSGRGTAALKTVQGGTIWLKMEGKKLSLKDEKGGVALVTIGDVNQSNGVIHVIDHVLLHQ